MANEQALQQAVSAIKAGDKTTGGKILHDILKLDRDNEAAWLWMSACVETDDDRRYCLEQALRVNPNNENAKRGLAKISSKQTPAPAAPPPQPAPPPVTPQPQEDSPFSFSQITAASSAAQPEPEPVFTTPAQPLPAADPAFPPPVKAAAPAPDPFTPPPAASIPAGSVPPKPNKSSRTIATILIAISGLCMLCVICGLIGSEIIRQNAQRAAATMYEVEYRVNAQPGVSVLVAYSDAADQMHELQLARYPWSFKDQMNGTTIAAVSATNVNLGQSVTCEIWVNGKLKAQVSAKDQKPALCMVMVGQ